MEREGPFGRLSAIFGAKFARPREPASPRPNALADHRPASAILDAFAFRSPLTLAGMKPLVEAATACPWWEGDSAYFDYLGARIGPGPRMLRLYPEGAEFVLQVRRGPMDDDVRRLILERVLPAVEATDARSAEGFD